MNLISSLSSHFVIQHLYIVATDEKCPFRRCGSGSLKEIINLQYNLLWILSFLSIIFSISTFENKLASLQMCNIILNCYPVRLCNELSCQINMGVQNNIETFNKTEKRYLVRTLSLMQLKFGESLIISLMCVWQYCKQWFWRESIWRKAEDISTGITMVGSTKLNCPYYSGRRLSSTCKISRFYYILLMYLITEYAFDCNCPFAPTASTSQRLSHRNAQKYPCLLVFDRWSLRRNNPSDWREVFESTWSLFLNFLFHRKREWQLLVWHGEFSISLHKILQRSIILH